MSARRDLEEKAALVSAEMPKILSGATASGLLRALLRTDEAEAQLRSALSSLPAVQLEVLRGALRERLAALTAPPLPAALLVDADLADANQLLALRKLVHSDAGGIPVIVTAPAAGTEELRQLMRLQIADFLPQPLTRADVVAAVESAMRKQQAPGNAQRHQCKVIAVVRRAGGSGATFIAIQTALELLGGKRKAPKRQVCLVDLDFQAGDTATYLDIDARLDIGEIARAPERLDPQLLQSMVSHHPSGLDLLASPPSLLELEAISGDAVARLLDVACEQYDFVVIDLPPSATRWTMNVLVGSDAILLVTRLTVAAVRQTKALLARLGSEGIGSDTLSVVVNAYRRSLFSRGVKLAAAQEALGTKADFVIADDPALVTTALDHGQTLQEANPGSRIERQIRDMVNHLLLRLEAGLPGGVTARARRSAGGR